MTKPDLRSTFLENKREIGYVRFLVMGLVWAGVTLVSIPLLVYNGPDVEAMVAPILVDQSTSDAHKTPDGKFLRYVWHFKKARAGRAAFAGFMMFSRQREKFAIEVYRGWECNDAFRTSRASMAGDTVAVKMCAKIPPELQNVPNLSVIGQIDYSTANPFWLVPQNVAPVKLGEGAEARSDAGSDDDGDSDP